MGFFGFGKGRKQRGEYEFLLVLHKYGASCESCEKKKKCKNDEGQVCVLYKGVTEKGVRFK